MSRPHILLGIEFPPENHPYARRPARIVEPDLTEFFDQTHGGADSRSMLQGRDVSSSKLPPHQFGANLAATSSSGQRISVHGMSECLYAGHTVGDSLPNILEHCSLLHKFAKASEKRKTCSSSTSYPHGIIRAGTTEC